MDYICAKFAGRIFSRFDFIIRTDRQNHTHTDACHRLKPGFHSNAIACVACVGAFRKRKPQETQALAFLAVFVYATHATQAINLNRNRA